MKHLIKQHLFIRSCLLVVMTLFLLSCTGNGQATKNEQASAKPVTPTDFSNADTATLAGGCFWCVEASFDQIAGVIEAVSGYAGGEEEDPKYREVANGNTGHAETVQIYYDPQVISYETLLDIFFTAHDPTQLNRQGPDVGPQYRSEIFYHNTQQKKLAQEKIAELQKTTYDKEIVTKLSPYTRFWKAEAYHQDYADKNPNDRYIQQVSLPKINKVKEKFADRLKE